MSIHGSGYLKVQIDEREAEIARLRSDLAVEKINNKRLQRERNNAESEIERLQHWKRKQMEDIMTLGQQVGKLEMERDKFRAALEEIAECDPEIHGGVIGIARRALANKD